ncbi:MAG: dihydropteroate synthase, partial [Bacteroidota bacterium]
VADAAMNVGAHMINDISGGQLDAKMYETVAKWQCPYFLMHMKGTPKTMMSQTDYDDLMKELLSYFAERIQHLHAMGIYDIIIDPGFGFSKDLRQNYYILKHLSALNVLGLPILSGISRKSMIYKKLGINSQEALNGTTVLNTISLIEGASILRVHDVKEAVEAVTLYKETYCY